MPSLRPHILSLTLMATNTFSWAVSLTGVLPRRPLTSSISAPSPMVLQVFASPPQGTRFFASGRISLPPGRSPQSSSSLTCSRPLSLSLRVVFMINLLFIGRSDGFCRSRITLSPRLTPGTPSTTKTKEYGIEIPKTLKEAIKICNRPVPFSG